MRNVKSVTALLAAGAFVAHGRIFDRFDPDIDTDVNEERRRAMGYLYGGLSAVGTAIGGAVLGAGVNGAECNEKTQLQCGTFGNGLRCNDNHKCADERCLGRGHLCMSNRPGGRSSENPNPAGNPFFLGCYLPDSAEYCGGPGSAGKECTCQAGGMQARNERCELCADCEPGLSCVIGVCMAAGTQQIGEKCGWNDHCETGSNCARSNYKCAEKPFVEDVCDSNGAATVGADCQNGCIKELPKSCAGTGGDFAYRNADICWGDECDPAAENQCGLRRVCREGDDQGKAKFRCILDNGWVKRNGQRCMDSSECHDYDRETDEELDLACVDPDGPNGPLDVQCIQKSLLKA
jgi:hypothetical protein